MVALGWISARERLMYTAASKFYVAVSVSALAFAILFLMVAIASWSIERAAVSPEIRFELRQTLQR